jgi:hypothetical protein
MEGSGFIRNIGELLVIHLLSAYVVLQAYCLLRLLFKPEDGGTMFLRNVWELLAFLASYDMLHFTL